MKTKLSIIIVNYHVKHLLYSCIESIIKSKPRVLYEVIVVDNDERKTISKDLKVRFPKVHYIANKNRGYGEGNNLGASYASGKFLCFLNPDTIVKAKSVDNLIEFLEKNQNVGIVAPILLDQDNIPYELQGTGQLTPFNSLFAYSFLNKIFPNNPVSKKFWMRGWNKSKTKQVEVVPGTAFMVRREIFEEVEGFDEKIFLYFEEYDICKRVSDLGYKIYIEPKSQFVHFWGESTKTSNLSMDSIFRQSRFYYLKKHFGFMQAVLSSFLLSINKTTIYISTIVTLGTILRIYKLNDLMIMISDQGWFYLSAKDMLSGNIPLVGITSSHTWLHQGPIWTYMLAGVLYLGKLNPVYGGYLSVFLDIISIIAIYYVGKKLFSNQVGMLTAILYATSPLIIIYSRMPYHTSPIPLLSILFLFALYEWVRGRLIYFPALILIVSLLYNFELASILFGLIIIVCFAYGLVRRANFSRIFDKKILILSLIAFIIPMLPILLYDIQNGFNQTIKFSAWVIAEALSLVGIKLIPQNPVEPWSSVVFYFLDKVRMIIFPASSFHISTIVIVLSILNIMMIYKKLKEKSFGTNYVVFFLCLTILIVGFFSQRALSGAYLPMLFPFIIIFVALWVEYSKDIVKLVTIVVVAASFVNIFSLLSGNYWPTGSALAPQVKQVKQVIGDSNSSEFTLKKKNFKSNIDIYQLRYLAFWQGGKIVSNSKNIYYIYNNSEGVPNDYIYKDKYISITKSLDEK